MTTGCDYHAIKEELRYVLENSELLGPCRAVVDEQMIVGADDLPQIFIFLLRRSAPDSQLIATGKKQIYHLEFAIYAFLYGLELKPLLKARDDMIMKIETVLMNNRTFNELVDTSWLKGGEMPSGRLQGDEVGVVAGGEILLTAEIEFNS